MCNHFMFGFGETRTARELTEDLGKSVRTLETINESDHTYTKEELVEHIKNVIVSGDIGNYDPEKLKELNYSRYIHFFGEMYQDLVLR